MDVTFLEDKILLEDKDDVIRVYIYTKLTQWGVKPYEHDIDILLELYNLGGYKNKEQQLGFINSCLEKKFKRTAQSVRNTLSKYTGLRILNKPKNSCLSLSKEFLSNVPSCDKIILKPLISHKN
jgi:hypothetical protein